MGLQAYLDGFYNFKVNLERFSTSAKEVRDGIFGPMVYRAERGVPVLTTLCMVPQGQSMGTLMDKDLTRGSGVKLFTGRRAGAEVRLQLASCDLLKNGKLKQLQKSTGCHFEMKQKHVQAFHRADKSVAAVFLVQCTIESCQGELLKSAAVHLRLQEAEDCQILAVARPPPGAEFAAAREEVGVISFGEASADTGMYVRHPTAGSMFCERIGSTEACMKLIADESTQEATRLSAVLFVCLTMASRVRYNMSVAVQASLSANGLLKAWRKGHDDTCKLDSKAVQLSLLV